MVTRKLQKWHIARGGSPVQVPSLLNNNIAWQRLILHILEDMGLPPLPPTPTSNAREDGGYVLLAHLPYRWARHGPVRGADTPGQHDTQAIPSTLVEVLRRLDNMESKLNFVLSIVRQNRAGHCKRRDETQFDERDFWTF